MFRKIIAALLTIEGGLFIVVGLAPGMGSTAQAYLSQRPDIISPNSLGEIIGVFPTLQRMMAMMGIICFAGGWGTLAQKKWSRWVAILASALNLPLVPVFAPLGIVGFVAFAKGDPELGEGDAAKLEKPMPISHLLVLLTSLVMIFHLLNPMRRFAAGQGLPMNAEPAISLQWILVGVFLFTIIHEMGHLVVAWAMGFQFREIKIGPVTLSERPGGSWAVQFSWKRMFMTGGYIRPIPQSLSGLKWNWIVVVAAGPLTSLLMAMLGVLVLLSVAGSELAAYWPWAAYMVTICVADCAANLLPLGVTDGAVIYHTAFETQRGKGILAGLEAAMLTDRAERAGGLMDPSELLETRRQALQSLEKDGEAPGMAVVEQQIELVRASLQNGKLEEAVTVLEGVGKSLRAFQEVPQLVSFHYWVQVFETANALGQYTTAAEARESALRIGEELAAGHMDWEDLVPIQLDRAQMMISKGDFLEAITAIQESRAACPERRRVTARAAELLALEAVCELRLGRAESATALANAAIAVSQDLDKSQRAKAMELLAHTAVRLSGSGDYELAQMLFAAGVAGLEKSASPAVAAGYRTAWAESLYENGKLEEAASVVAPIDSAQLGFALDVEALRAQLLLAEDRPKDAIAALNPLLTVERETAAGDEKLGLARAWALRSWAFFRNGDREEALADARKACDLLIPAEHPDAAPALLTLAMEVADNDPELADAYLQEGTRLICEAAKFTSLTKASRLTDLARCLVQVRRRDWAKRFIDQATKIRRSPLDKLAVTASR